MTRRRILAAAVLLAFGGLGVAFCGNDGQDGGPLPPDLPVPYDGFPTHAEPAAAEQPDAFAEPEDAGALLDAWATALRPVLTRDGGSSTAAVWVSARDGGTGSNPFAILLKHMPALADAGGPRLAAVAPPDEAWDEPPRPDAGLTCHAGPVHISFERKAIDLILAIDTSGSMFRTLPMVNDWLVNRLEAALRAGNIDYQLMVLVDLENLRRTVEIAERRKRRGGKSSVWSPSDGGINLAGEVLSNDALDVLLASASQLDNSWLSRLRPGVPVHVLVVTDDAPREHAVAQFVSQITDLAGGRLGTPSAPDFTFHGLLGMDTSAEAWVISPDRPIVSATTDRCGISAGFDYQTLARQTHGLRGSVCHDQSLNAFTEALLGDLRTRQLCAAALPPNFPAASPIALIAYGQGKTTQLTRAHDSDDCDQSFDGYEVKNGRVRICPVTCQSLVARGFTHVIAEGVCP